MTEIETVLAKLVAQRDELDTAIRVLKRQAGGDNGMEDGPVATPDNARASSEIRGDSFFGLTLGDAAVKYLGLARRPQSLKEIETALTHGGFTHTSKHFHATLFTSLKRRCENPGDVVKVKRGQWGLTAWYPGAKRRRPEETDRDETVVPTQERP